MNCDGRSYNVFEKQACKGAIGCQPHQPIMTTEQSQRSKVFDFHRGRKTGWSGKPSWHSREPTHNSHGPGRESNWGHLGERRALYTQLSQPCHAQLCWQTTHSLGARCFLLWALRAPSWPRCV